MKSRHKIIGRWKKAQTSEAEGWKEFGVDPRHFDKKYWNWELRFLGLNIEFFKNMGVDKILEVGGGPFGMIHFIETNGAKISVEPLAVELKNMGFEREGKNVLSIAAMGEALPIASDTVDIIICFNVLDHVAKAEEVLRECNRVLRPQGIILLNVNVMRPSLRFMKLFLAKIDKSHPFHWASDEVLGMLADTGFEVVYKSCKPRNNYRFSLRKDLNSRKETARLSRSIAYLRIGDNEFLPAKGNVLKHMGSNLMHMRLDVRAQKRNSP